MLTFETLSRIAREEKATPNLSKLPEGFFEDVASYISKKAQLKEGKDENLELENARMVLGDITKSRERKILTAALGYLDSGMEPASLAPEEKVLFDKAAAMIIQFRQDRKRFLEPGIARNSMLAFLEEVPQFVGTDMKNYGPFAKGDVANLPEDVTRLLMEKGAAKPIEQKGDDQSGETAS
jgi:DNA replication initiation complex subunit (GINS family)